MLLLLLGGGEKESKRRSERASATPFKGVGSPLIRPVSKGVRSTLSRRDVETVSLRQSLWWPARVVCSHIPGGRL